MHDDNLQARNQRIEKKRIIIHLISFTFAAIFSISYFFNFITLIICAGYIIFDREIRWKIHGLVLGFFSGLASFISIASTAKPPLNMTIMIFFPAIGIYILMLFIGKYYKESFLKGNKINFFENFKKILSKIEGNPKILKLSFFLLGIILPMGLWSSVNIDLGVAFDNSPKMLWIYAPSTPDINETFKISIEAWDNYERLSASYLGTVDISIDSYSIENYELMDSNSTNAILPDKYTFTGQPPKYISDSAYLINDGKDNGIKSFSISISTPGIHYIKVRDISEEKLNIKSKIPYKNALFYSNPIIIYSNDSGINDKLYWGDIHTHSIQSDGSGTPEHNAFYAKEIAHLDFYALTDHSEIMFFQPWTFEISEQVTNNAYKPNEFVTFHGIEWTNIEYGHYTLIFSKDKLLHPPDLMPGRFGPLSTTNRLWSDLDRFTESTNCLALALPHHTTKESYLHDWSYFNPKYVRIAEVTSTHGDSLYAHRESLNYRGATGIPAHRTYGSSITDALKMGRNLTLYASSDSHDGHPGHTLTHSGAAVGHQRPLSNWATRTDKPYPGGLTAVFSPELTRESVFDGLYNTRLYASSDYGRPFIQFSINNVTVGDGSTLNLQSNNLNRTIKILVAQDGSPASNFMQSSPSLVGENWKPNWNSTIEILKNGELLYSENINSSIAQIEYIDTEEILGTNFKNCIERNGNFYVNQYSDHQVDPSSLTTDGRDFYILRVVNEYGRHAYVGAIWVEKID